MSYQEGEGLGKYYDPRDLSGKELPSYVNSLSSPELCDEQKDYRGRWNKLRFIEAAVLVGSCGLFAVSYKMAEKDPVALLLGAGIAVSGYFLSRRARIEAMIYKDFLNRIEHRLGIYALYPNIDVSRPFEKIDDTK